MRNLVGGAQAQERHARRVWLRENVKLVNSQPTTDIMFYVCVAGVSIFAFVTIWLI